MNLFKEEKSNLIRNGTFQRYRDILKDIYSSGYIPSDDPAAYMLSEQEKMLCDRLLLSTKRKKAKFRNHTWFLHQYYDNVGFLTLTYSDLTRDSSTLDTKKEIVTRILNECFLDYIGKPELSPNGKLHFHFMVAWNGEINKDDFVLFKRDGFDVVNIRKHDLQSLWYGTENNKKYGIYELTLVPKSRLDSNKISNYALKSLNTMDSYILKSEELDLSEIISDELIYQVNTSNIMAKRNTPFQNWNKAYQEQMKFIKHQARVFDTSFYEENMHSNSKVFKDWASRNIGHKATDYLYIIPNNFKLIEIKDF